jgi:hypothetical protein
MLCQFLTGRLNLTFMMIVLSANICWAQATSSPSPANPDFEFIDTSFENASPLYWEVNPEGEIVISLKYDHQRGSLNRAAGHWHFQVQGKPGTTHTLILQNFSNIWNGKPGLAVEKETATVLSEDGKMWHSIGIEYLPDTRIKFPVTLGKDGTIFVARVEPYRVSDLNRFLKNIETNPLIKIEKIGETVENRPLEIIRVGNADAPHRLFLRARAHPWEPGGSWIVQGLINKLLDGSPESEACLNTYCTYIMPMANKDGVAHGYTRFNLKGWDLNRKWDEPAPEKYCPENYDLEQWLLKMIAQKQAPELAIELHNDSSGKMHLSFLETEYQQVYLKKMKLLENELREHTWFTNGTNPATFRNPGSLPQGWLERFQVDGIVLEFNANWIAKKEKRPMGADWEEFGQGMTLSIKDYFEQVNH